MFQPSPLSRGKTHCSLTDYLLLWFIWFWCILHFCWWFLLSCQCPNVFSYPMVSPTSATGVSSSLAPRNKERFSGRTWALSYAGSYPHNSWDRAKSGVRFFIPRIPKYPQVSPSIPKFRNTVWIFDLKFRNTVLYVHQKRTVTRFEPCWGPYSASCLDKVEWTMYRRGLSRLSHVSLAIYKRSLGWTAVSTNGETPSCQISLELIHEGMDTSGQQVLDFLMEKSIPRKGKKEEHGIFNESIESLTMKNVSWKMFRIFWPVVELKNHPFSRWPKRLKKTEMFLLGMDVLNINVAWNLDNITCAYGYVGLRWTEHHKQINMCPLPKHGLADNKTYMSATLEDHQARPNINVWNRLETFCSYHNFRDGLLVTSQFVQWPKTRQDNAILEPSTVAFFNQSPTEFNSFAVVPKLKQWVSSKTRETRWTRSIVKNRKKKERVSFKPDDIWNWILKKGQPNIKEQQKPSTNKSITDWWFEYCQIGKIIPKRKHMSVKLFTKTKQNHFIHHFFTDFCWHPIWAPLLLTPSVVVDAMRRSVRIRTAPGWGRRSCRHWPSPDDTSWWRRGTPRCDLFAEAVWKFAKRSGWTLF